jgi:hypothetical protein
MKNRMGAEGQEPVRAAIAFAAAVGRDGMRDKMEAGIRDLEAGAAAPVPAIEACDQAETLRSWTLQCAKLSDRAFVTLVTGKPRARAARSQVVGFLSSRSAKR